MIIDLNSVREAIVPRNLGFFFPGSVLKLFGVIGKGPLPRLVSLVPPRQ